MLAKGAGGLEQSGGCTVGDATVLHIDTFWDPGGPRSVYNICTVRGTGSVLGFGCVGIGNLVGKDNIFENQSGHLGFHAGAKFVHDKYSAGFGVVKNVVQGLVGDSDSVQRDILCTAL